MKEIPLNFSRKLTLFFAILVIQSCCGIRYYDPEVPFTSNDRLPEGFRKFPTTYGTGVEYVSPGTSQVSGSYAISESISKIPVFGGRNGYRLWIRFFNVSDNGDKGYVELSPEQKGNIFVNIAVFSDGKKEVSINSSMEKWICTSSPYYKNRHKRLHEYWPDYINYPKSFSKNDAFFHVGKRGEVQVVVKIRTKNGVIKKSVMAEVAFGL